MRAPRALRIGYYVHHHGRGHATRAGVIGGALRARGHAVTYLGSGALPGGEQEGDRVVVARDDVGTHFPDANAGARLHWAPLGGGYAERSRQLAHWISAVRPDVVVVDVSVEVTLLVRLLGVPVVVVAQPGVRDDPPHDLAYDVASAVVAPWPAELDVAPHLGTWSSKVVAVGGISRFASRGSSVPRAGTSLAACRRGVLLVGGEGWDDAELPTDLVERMGDVSWSSPSPLQPLVDLLAAADVVVTHAGQNAIADVASFGVPAVVLAQHRPFDEQADMAAALTRAGIARGLAPDADVTDVVAAVRSVLTGSELAGDDAVASGRAWQRWLVDGAPERVCAVVERAAEGLGSDPQEDTP